MTKPNNAELQKVLDLVKKFFESQIAKLPPDIAKVKRKELHKIISSATRPARRKRSKPSGTGAKRRSRRSRTKNS